MKKIILASSSKARKELLKILIGDNFTIQHSNYEEDNFLKMNPVKLTSFLSLNKAREVATRNKKGIIIAADTLVFLGKKVLGKPKNRVEAIKTLTMLSNKTHTVVTGLTVIDIDNKKEFAESVTTKVRFGKLTKEEIIKYVDAFKPLDMSGAYGFTDMSATFIERIDGDYYSVVGLPLYTLSQMLRKCNINLYKIK